MLEIKPGTASFLLNLPEASYVTGIVDNISKLLPEKELKLIAIECGEKLKMPDNHCRGNPSALKLFTLGQITKEELREAWNCCDMHRSWDLDTSTESAKIAIQLFLLTSEEGEEKWLFDKAFEVYSQIEKK